MTYNQENMLYNQKQNILSKSQKQPLYNGYNNFVNKTFNHSRFCKNEPKHRYMNLSFSYSKQNETNQSESNWRCGILTFKNNTQNKNESKILYNKTLNEICTNWNNKWDSDNLFGWKNTRLM